MSYLFNLDDLEELEALEYNKDNYQELGTVLDNMEDNYEEF